MRVPVGDVRLFFDVEGPQLVPDGSQMREKSTLLLLHGGPGFDHSSLEDVVHATAGRGTAPFANSEDIAAALPAQLVRLEEFPGCGHPVYQDDPERFVQTVRDFLASL
jgi:pimeloyl-ACP methyl ester carboxylesterase